MKTSNVFTGKPYHAPGEFTHLYMRFDLRPQLLQMLHYRPLNSSTQVRVLVGDRARLVTNAVENVLITRIQFSGRVRQNRG